MDIFNDVETSHFLQINIQFHGSLMYQQFQGGARAESRVVARNKLRAVQHKSQTPTVS